MIKVINDQLGLVSLTIRYRPNALCSGWSCKHLKPLNQKTVMAKFITHTSTYSIRLISGFVEYCPCDFLCLMHSTCTGKPTEHHQTLLRVWYWSNPHWGWLGPDFETRRWGWSINNQSKNSYGWKLVYCTIEWVSLCTLMAALIYVSTRLTFIDSSRTYCELFHQ